MYKTVSLYYMYMSQKPDPCVINITPPPIHSIHYNFWYTEILLNSELTMVKSFQIRSEPAVWFP